jgi:hypothetical protein
MYVSGINCFSLLYVNIYSPRVTPLCFVRKPTPSSYPIHKYCNISEAVNNTVITDESALDTPYSPCLIQYTTTEDRSSSVPSDATTQSIISSHSE